MQWLVAASALLALAAAAPAPQEIDFAQVEEVAAPTFSMATGVTAQIVTYNPATIISAALSQITASQTVDSGNEGLAKRSACAVQPSGATGAPVVTPDTPSAYAANPAMSSTALAAPTPVGYTQTFQNLNASNNAYGYMGFTTLQTYDVDNCAAQCNAINGCLSINIYFERDPSVDPGSGCPNPPSVNMIKCVFWGGPVNAGNANNYGQYRDEFEVVIAGSNGYTNNSIAAVPGYTTATDLGDAAINAPLDSYGCNTFLGSAVFNSGPFNASLCAEACSLKSAYSLAHPPSDGGPPQTCQFFNTYILYINTTSDPQGQYCAMYSETWSSSYATNTGQYRGNDDYLIEYSYSYSNATNPGYANEKCAVYQAVDTISYSSLQPYCSSFLGYTVPVTTVDATTTVMTSTSVTTYTSDVTTTVTLVPRQDDSDDDDDSDATPVVTAIPVSLLAINTTGFDAEYTTVTYTPNITASANTTTTPTANEKRQVSSTPAGLTQYPSAVIASACGIEVTSPTQTSTVTSYISATDVVPSTTTVTDVVATATATCAVNTNSFYLTSYDTGITAVDGVPMRGLAYGLAYLGWPTAGLGTIVWSMNSAGNIYTKAFGITFELAFYNTLIPNWVLTYIPGTTSIASPVTCTVNDDCSLSCSAPNVRGLKCNGQTPSTVSQFALSSLGIQKNYLMLEPAGSTANTPITLYIANT